MKKLLLVLLTLSIVFSLASCDLFNKDCTEHVDSNKDGKCDVCEEDMKTPCTEHVDADKNGKCDNCAADVEVDDGVMTYAEFAAAAIDDEVTVVTYVQAKQGWWNNKGVDVASFYTQAPDGAYFLYDMPCTEAEYNALVPGTCIKVTGTKAEWSGEVEIVDATFEILTDKTPYVATATDITEKVMTEADLSGIQNSLIGIERAIVIEEAIYKWDGTGTEGDDLYITLGVGGKEFTVVVESYLHGNGSTVYEAIENAEEGDVLAIEAFLYWYNGAQPHVNKVTKVENLFDSIMDYEAFAAAELDSKVTVVTCVQAKQGWWNNEGVDVASFYTQNPDGEAYFLYDMPCSKAEYDALVPGTTIIVTGYKAAWSGEVEIIDATFDIFPGITFDATATDITADITAGTDVIAHQNKLVAINGATVSAAPIYKWDGSGSEGDDIYLTLTVGTNELTVVVESYLHGNGSDVYEAVEALEIGDVIDVEAFLYWYNGAQPHVNKVVVK